MNRKAFLSLLGLLASTIVLPTSAASESHDFPPPTTVSFLGVRVAYLEPHEDFDENFPEWTAIPYKSVQGVVALLDNGSIIVYQLEGGKLVYLSTLERKKLISGEQGHLFSLFVNRQEKMYSKFSDFGPHSIIKIQSKKI